jgi:hypothetical protein
VELSARKILAANVDIKEVDMRTAILWPTYLKSRELMIVIRWRTVIVYSMTTIAGNRPLLTAEFVGSRFLLVNPDWLTFLMMLWCATASFSRVCLCALSVGFFCLRSFNKYEYRWSCQGPRDRRRQHPNRLEFRNHCAIAK